jgi:hypothetical protein
MPRHTARSTKSAGGSTRIHGIGVGSLASVVPAIPHLGAAGFSEFPYCSRRVAALFWAGFGFSVTVVAM